MNSIFLSKNFIYNRESHHLITKRTAKNEFYFGYHYHDFYEATVFFCERKDVPIGTLTLSEKEYPLHSGDVILISAFEPHVVRMDLKAEYTRYCVNFDLDFLLASSSDDSNIYSIFSHDCPNYPIKTMSESVLWLIKTLIHQLTDYKLRYGNDVYEKSLIVTLLAILFDNFYSEDMSFARSRTRYISLVSEIVQYVNNNLNSNMSLNTISTLVNYSPSYVSRIFHQYTGITLNQYITGKRIDRAKILLNNPDLSISAISKMVGFENYNHFFRTFRLATGQSPTDFRASI